MLHPNIVPPRIVSKVLYFAYWVLAFTQVFSFRTAGIGPTERAEYLDVAAVIRLSTVLFVLFVLGTLLLLRSLPRRAVQSRSLAETAVLLLIGVFAVSTAWSRLPSTAVFRIVQLAAATWLTWELMASWGREGSHDVIWRLSLPALVAGLANGLFAPGRIEIHEAGQISFLYRFKENACGHVAAIALVGSLTQILWKLPSISHRRLLGRLGLSTIGLVLFQSGSGWLLLQIGVVATVLKKRSVVAACGGACVVLLTLFTTSPLHVMSAALGGKEPERIGTLSTRTALYPAAIRFGLESPLVGHGFLADSILSDFADEVGWLPQNAHNGYLSAFLNVGVVGLCFLLVAFFAVFHGLRSIKVPRVSRESEALVFRLRLAVAMVAVGNCVESWVGDKFTLVWPLFVALAVVPSLGLGSSGALGHSESRDA